MKVCSRIHYHEPVSPSEVLNYAAEADVGLCLIEDTCLSYRYCLPNKLFESLLSGLPVLVSDLPDQAQVIRNYNAGWVLPSAAGSLSTFLSQLTIEEAQSMRYGLKERVSDLCWTNEAKVLFSIYEKLLAGRTRPS
jgi:glycosyltransferase involved in cell wall biosynthesis